MYIIPNNNSGQYNIKPYTGSEQFLIHRLNAITISTTSNIIVYTGSTINFSSNVRYPEDVTTYQWKSNGSNVGTNSSTYSITGATFGDYIITCTITSHNINYVSNSIEVIVLEGDYLPSSPLNLNTSIIYTIPTGVSHLHIEGWGAGGGSGYALNAAGVTTSGGGGGGAYSRKMLPVTPNTSIYLTIGAGGTAGVVSTSNGGNGGNTIVNYNGVNVVIAAGGSGSISRTTTGNGAGGAGGSSTSSTGDTCYDGGSGKAGASVAVVGIDVCSNISGITYGGVGGGRGQTGSTGAVGESPSILNGTSNEVGQNFRSLKGGYATDIYSSFSGGSYQFGSGEWGDTESYIIYSPTTYKPMSTKGHADQPSTPSIFEAGVGAPGSSVYDASIDGVRGEYGKLFISYQVQGVTINMTGDTTLFSGQTRTLSASQNYLETGATYQWKLDGVNVATGTTYTTLSSITNGTHNITCVMTTFQTFNSNTITITKYDNQQLFAVGDVVSGGTVFYIWNGGLKALIAANSDVSAVCYGNVLTTGAIYNGITSGITNTDLIISTDTGSTSSPKAAIACRSCNQSGYTDWYLPSEEEQIQLYTNRGVINNWHTSNSEYITSTEVNSTTYRIQIGGTMYNSTQAKTASNWLSDIFYARPIRYASKV